MAAQQQLRLALPSRASFANFQPGPNRAVLRALQDFAARADEGQIFLYGPPGTGKSHLAQSVARQAWDLDQTAQYLPLSPSLALTEQSLAGLDPQGLTVIDDLTRLDRNGELVLLRLIDQIRSAGGRLLLTADSAAGQLQLRLPDLRSRLTWGAQLALQPLRDEDLLGLLHQRARHLGVKLPRAVSDYMLKRLPREPEPQLALLNQAHDRAVAQGRQLTVPLLRDTLQALATDKQVAGDEP